MYILKEVKGSCKTEFNIKPASFHASTNLIHRRPRQFAVHSPLSDGTANDLGRLRIMIRISDYKPGGGPLGIPYNCFCGVGSVRRKQFFLRLQKYHRVGISQVEVYDRERHLTLVCKKRTSHPKKKFEKTLWFEPSYLKESAFKRVACEQQTHFRSSLPLRLRKTQEGEATTGNASAVRRLLN